MWIEEGGDMVDWIFAWKIFFISIMGTFISIGILALTIRLASFFLTQYFPNDKGLKE